MKVITILAITAAFITATPVMAQDGDLAPIYSDVELSAGFETDPQIISVVSGGSINLGARVAGCDGYISQAPLVRMTFVADKSPSALPLFIHVFSKGDTTLIVKAPDGKWYCNDDGFNGHNPMLIFGPAMSGGYEIWLGSFRPAESHEALIAFSETGADITALEAQLSKSNGR